MIIDQYGKKIDPFAPIGSCDICGADAWTTSICGVLCPSHEHVLDDYLSEQERERENEDKLLPTVDEVVDALEDAGFAVDAIYPYVIVSLKNRPVSILSVQIVLDFAKLDYSRSGNSVLIRF